MIDKRTASLFLSLIFVFLWLSFAYCGPSPSYIAIYGDSRTGHDIHRQIVKAISSYKPSIVFHTGDIVREGPGDWPLFNEITSELRKNAEFFAAIGNHEYGVGVKLFFENFELPNNEQWYSVDRSGIHFIVLNSNLRLFKVSEQYKWLRSDLQNIKDDIKFIIVIFHHPIIGSTKVPRFTYKYNALPLFKKYGVDVVFAGHNHAYERCFKDGIYHITTGGGGASLYSKRFDIKYSQKYVKTHHFCLLHVENDTLFVEAVNRDLNTIDSFSVQRAAKRPTVQHDQ
jgi:predicted phosphodiesterase